MNEKEIKDNNLFNAWLEIKGSGLIGRKSALKRRIEFERILNELENESNTSDYFKWIIFILSSCASKIDLIYIKKENYNKDKLWNYKTSVI